MQTSQAPSITVVMLNESLESDMRKIKLERITNRWLMRSQVTKS